MVFFFVHIVFLDFGYFKMVRCEMDCVIQVPLFLTFEEALIEIYELALNTDVHVFIIKY